MKQATIDGATYTAKPNPHNVGSCAGCAANDQRNLASENRELCRHLPPCSGPERADGRFVVWVKGE